VAYSPHGGWCLHFNAIHDGDRSCSFITNPAVHWWRGLHSDVKTYVDQCVECQAGSSARLERNATLQPVRVAALIERVSVDLIGPLPASFPLKNKYCLTAIEHASRYALAYPLPTKAAPHIAAALLHLVSVVGAPRILQSDSGSEWLSSTTQSLLRRYDIKHRMSSSGHPHSQGLVERFNKTLTDQLVKVCSTRDVTMWEAYLTDILLGYNSSRHDSTKLEPGRVFFGRLPRLVGPSGQPTNEPRQLTLHRLLPLLLRCRRSRLLRRHWWNKP